MYCNTKYISRKCGYPSTTRLPRVNPIFLLFVLFQMRNGLATFDTSSELQCSTLIRLAGRSSLSAASLGCSVLQMGRHGFLVGKHVNLGENKGCGRSHVALFNSWDGILDLHRFF
jgi:hypothetical protein